MRLFAFIILFCIGVDYSGLEPFLGPDYWWILLGLFFFVDNSEIKIETAQRSSSQRRQFKWK